MLREQEHQQAQHWATPAASGQRGPRDKSPLQTSAQNHHRITLKSEAGGCSTYLVMQIHHEWVLVGRVSGWVKHSWRRAGKSVGAGLIYRDVRLLGEGRVHLGLILAQQGCQRSVASSPLTPGRGAAGPPQERNRAGVTPQARGAPQPQAGWLQEDQWQPNAQSEMLRALCQATPGWAAPEPASLLTLQVPSPCPQHKKDPCSPGTPHLGQVDVLPCQCSPKPHWEPVPCPSRTREPAPRPHVSQGTGLHTTLHPVPSPEVVGAAAGSPRETALGKRGRGRPPIHCQFPWSHW